MPLVGASCGRGEDPARSGGNRHRAAHDNRSGARAGMPVQAIPRAPRRNDQRQGERRQQPRPIEPERLRRWTRSEPRSGGGAAGRRHGRTPARGIEVAHRLAVLRSAACEAVHRRGRCRGQPANCARLQRTSRRRSLKRRQQNLRVSGRQSRPRRSASAAEPAEPHEPRN